MKELSFIERYGDEIAARDGGWYCHYCWIPLERRSAIADDPCSNGFGAATIDHKIPHYYGGGDNVGNLVLCCSRCNGEKGVLAYEPFFKRTARRRARRKGKRGIDLYARLFS